MPKREIIRKFSGSRLLKNYGSWLYCENCGKTVAYICYTTYKWLKVKFACKCGAKGKAELVEKGTGTRKPPASNKNLSLIGNRYCCPKDEKPLFSVVGKQVKTFEYSVCCLECGGTFHGKIRGN